MIQKIQKIQKIEDKKKKLTVLGRAENQIDQFQILTLRHLPSGVFSSNGLKGL